MSELTPEQYIELLREKINATKIAKNTSVSKSTPAPALTPLPKLDLKPISKQPIQPQKPASKSIVNNFNLKKYAKNILIAGIILKTASSIYENTKD